MSSLLRLELVHFGPRHLRLCRQSPLMMWYPEDDTAGATTSAGTGTEEVTRGLGGGKSLDTAAVRGEGAVTTPTSQQQRPAPFDGKVA